MKIRLFSLVLSVSFLLSGSLYAASHNRTKISDALQPAEASQVILTPDDFAERESLEFILQQLKDPDPFIRVEAVQALGEIKRQEALLPVCNCLNDENIYVRAYAAEAVGKIGHVDTSFALLRLISSLDDPSPYVRAMMVAALGELQDERAVGPIRKLLDDEDESVRGMAAWALEQIGANQ